MALEAKTVDAVAKAAMIIARTIMYIGFAKSGINEAIRFRLERSESERR